MDLEKLIKMYEKLSYEKWFKRFKSILGASILIGILTSVIASFDSTASIFTIGFKAFIIAFIVIYFFTKLWDALDV